MITSYIVYVLGVRDYPCNIIVEFSSCSSDECNFSFYYGNGTQIPIDETTYQYGKQFFPYKRNNKKKNIFT